MKRLIAIVVTVLAASLGSYFINASLQADRERAASERRMEILRGEHRAPTEVGIRPPSNDYPQRSR